MAEGKPNVQVILHKDFGSYGPEVLEKLEGAEGCIWAQGVSATQVDKEEYKRITIDYPMAAAKEFSSLSDIFKFVYVSGEGATTSPGMMTPYFGRIKGQCEADLIALSKTSPSLKPFSLRLGMVDSHNHPEVIAAISTRNEPASIRMMKQVLEVPIRTFWPGMTTPTPEIGKFMVDLALSKGEAFEGLDVEGEGRTLPNKAIRRIVKEGVLAK